jgi:N-acetylglucosamine-6-phosphate deacetylase
MRRGARRSADRLCVVRLGVAAALVGGAWLPGDVLVREGRIESVGSLGSLARRSGMAVAGFIDLQVNGYAGVDLAGADRAGYELAGRSLLAAGTTAYQPTFVTAPPEAMRESLRAMPPSGAEIAPRVIGAHLEGPFISPRRTGAHDPRFVAEPEPELLRSLLASGPVTRVTLAPELPGALELVDELVVRGVAIAAGHTEASAAQAHAAFDRGVRSVAHLHNAMAPGTPREPSIVAAALARQDVVVELIVDGHHLAGDTVLATWRAATGRLALVSDAVAAAGSGPGDFVLGGRTIRAGEDGAVRSPDGRLAGTALSLHEAVRNLHALGVPLEQALTAATATPASVCGRPDLGDLRPGTVADVVVLDDRLAIERVLVAGHVVVAS